jgi:hypothetical protein
VAGKDNQDAVGDGLSRKAGTGGPEGEWNVVLLGELEQTADLIERGWLHNRLWDKAKVGGIIGICIALERPSQYPFIGQDGGEFDV